MAKNKDLPARGQGWSDRRWAEYVRSQGQSDPDPGRVQVKVTRTDSAKAQEPRRTWI